MEFMEFIDFDIQTLYPHLMKEVIIHPFTISATRHLRNSKLYIIKVYNNDLIAYLRVGFKNKKVQLNVVGLNGIFLKKY